MLPKRSISGTEVHTSSPKKKKQVEENQVNDLTPPHLSAESHLAARANVKDVSLEETVKRTVEVLDLAGDTIPAESISFLTEALKQKDQLQKMIKDKESKAVNLVSICLGELGVIDLCSLTLEPTPATTGDDRDDHGDEEPDYLKKAQTALSSSAFFSAVWFGSQRLEQLDKLGQDRDSEERRLIHELLFTAYTSTGEPDCYAGFKSLLDDPAWDVQRYQQESKWFQVLEWNDALASYSVQSSERQSILASLSRCGLYRTMADLTWSYDHSDRPSPSSSTGSAASNREYQYECAWRLGNWDHCLKTEAEGKPGLEEQIFNLLSSLRIGDHLQLQDSIADARMCVVNQLHGASLESCQKIYPSLTSLQLLREVETVSNLMDRSSFSVEDLKDKWSESDQLSVSDFKFLEPVLALRCVILKEIVAPKDQLRDPAILYLIDMLLDICRQSRLHGNYQVATRCLAELMTLNLSPAAKYQYCLEKCLTEWQRKDRDSALNSIRSLVKMLAKDCPSSAVYPEALILLGQWLLETRSENPRKILADYLFKSMTVALEQQGSGQIAVVSKARQVLASYADSMYSEIVSFMESGAFQIKETTLKRREKEGKSTLVIEKENLTDRSEIKKNYQDREFYLLIAVQNYLVGIAESGSAGDLQVCRVVSLWFDNMNNARLTSFLLNLLPKIPSHYFISVLPQLAARLTVKSNILMELIERCAIDHPHHTIPVILALVLANKDEEFNPGSRPLSENQEEDRVLAAKKLLQKLKETAIGSLCKKMEQMHISLIKLANQSTTNRTLPAELTSVYLRYYEDLAVPTVPISVGPVAVDNQLIRLVRFAGKFELVGGLKEPKKISCLGTDGRWRPMLVKGKDDLRQDAVMQQVFSVMNNFLQLNEETRKRQLRIRTYKVVPLSRRSGILEWCENAIPIGHYLIGKDQKSGAHAHYFPNDYTSEECSDMLKKELAEIKDLKERTQRFEAICTRFHPVFRNFFLERFPTPSVWFEKRVAYTRSVAASSMVGYILGLGDRHLMNILIDEITAEVIHIDLGIAFDQGLLLEVPEKVPFRLTRDIVDPMGVMGVEGIFRRCCESTLDVVRQKQDYILTLLEVLLSDPLRIWTKQAAGLQGHKGNSTKEDDAGYDSSKRALVRLSQKLKGIESGTPLSVHGQVNELIQQAQDASNLCRMFHGWMPHA